MGTNKKKHFFAIKLAKFLVTCIYFCVADSGQYIPSPAVIRNWAREYENEQKQYLENYKNRVGDDLVFFVLFLTKMVKIAKELFLTA